MNLEYKRKGNKCRYCSKELPEVINSRRDVCKCEKAQKEHAIQMNINHYEKMLNLLKEELSKLRK